MRKFWNKLWELLQPCLVGYAIGTIFAQLLEYFLK